MPAAPCAGFRCERPSSPADRSLARLERRLAVEGCSLDPQLHSLPVDETDDLQGHERVADEGPRDGRVRQRPAFAREHRAEAALPLLVDVDSGVHTVAWLREMEAVLLVESEEWRDVQPFRT